MKLTMRQSLFSNEYLVDFNAKQATIRAGYSARTAEQQGCKLLSMVKVQEKIAELTAERSSENKATIERIIKELCAIAFTKLTDIVYVNDQGKATVKPTAELTDAQQRAIESISQTQYGVKIKMHDKTKAIELLGRHLGMWLDRVEVNKGDKASSLTEDQLRAILDDDSDDQ